MNKATKKNMHARFDHLRTWYIHTHLERRDRQKVLLFLVKIRAGHWEESDAHHHHHHGGAIKQHRGF
jgi:hypothetical protein